MRATVLKVVNEVCLAIWNALRHIYLKFPESAEELENIAKGLKLIGIVYAAFWQFHIKVNQEGKMSNLSYNLILGLNL